MTNETNPKADLAIHSADNYAFLGWIAYSLGALLICLPFADIILGMLPIQFGNIRWRIGVTGLATGALLLPLVGLFMLLAVSHLRGDRRTQYVLGTLTTLAAVGMLVVLVFFALDTVQLRREIDPERRTLYDRAALKGIVTQFFTFVVLVIMSLGSLRASLKVGRREKTRRKEGEPIVMARVSDNPL